MKDEKPVMFPAKINKANALREYSINYVKVSKFEFMDYLSHTKGKERLKVVPLSLSRKSIESALGI